MWWWKAFAVPLLAAMALWPVALLADPLADACLGDAPAELPADVALDQLELQSDGLDIGLRLAGLADIPGDDAVARAREWLDGATVYFAPAAGAEPDRYGRLPVFLLRKDRPRSLQEELLASGNARLGHRDITTECHAYLFEREDEAIAAQRGLWADPRFSVAESWRPDMMLPRMDSYQIVEGRLLSTGRTARRLYLNFGYRWSEDFTVEIGRRGEAALSDAGKHPEDWVGARVRVRGWLSESRGPLIVLESANQIERLAD